MRLAVFDVDGTLTDTKAVDYECFVRAVADELGVDRARLDLSEVPHVTDAAIAAWLSKKHRGRDLSEDENVRLIDSFVRLLRAELARAAARFAPVAGAPGLFAELRATGWEVAIATGGWAPSAQLKLTASGLAEPGLVMATASDASTRVEILRLALGRARERARGDYRRIVSVGDGVWDVRAAADLGLAFVGVGQGAAADALRGAGATRVLPDFSDRAALRDALETAIAPAR
jgi:phosphoglycolate phosphatase-like HAD superfamily hydrolase